MTDRFRETAEELITFLGRCPSCFHVADSIREMLLDEGFTELYEADRWELIPGGRYFVMRNHSSVISFRIPETPLRKYRFPDHRFSCGFTVSENQGKSGNENRRILHKA